MHLPKSSLTMSPAEWLVAARERIAEFLMNRLPEVTAHRHDDAYLEFLNWLRPLQLDPASATADVLDWAAADFLLEKFESELFQYGQALALLAALRRRNPRLRVPTAGKLVPPLQAEALPHEVAYAAFAVRWALGPRGGSPPQAL